ncbi:MAG: manganese efflux pump [Clostridiales bacterium]|nr:manganese efflux pump [Clostridiales bacterium]
MKIFGFVMNSFLLGIGLSMDVFSVSLANGLNEPEMRRTRMFGVAGTFAGFHGIMPLTGWACIHAVAKAFAAFKYYIPWIALVLLIYIGGKMLIEGVRATRNEKKEAEYETAAESDKRNKLTAGNLMVQGIGTSIDAMSVGCSIAECGFLKATLSALIIAVITFVICFFGIAIGKKCGTKLAGKASIFGGIILVAIGIQIWAKGVLL